MQPDVSSPYMLWQYMNAMKPQKSSDYVLHPAFTHPATAYTTLQPGCEQSVGSYGYQRHQQQVHHPYMYSRHTDVASKQNFQNEGTFARNNVKKHNYKNRTERLMKASYNETKHSEEPIDLISLTKCPRSSSPMKGSSFTIDAILRRDERVKSHGDDAIASDDSLLTTHVKPEHTFPSERVDSTSPPCMTACSPTSGRLYGPPVMHSTPCSQERKHGRFYDFPQPYLFHQYDSLQSQHQQPHHHPHHHTQTLGSSQLTSSSLTSLSSLSSVSSPASISPESSATLHKGKLERKHGGKPKRIRTIFTPEQLDKLEAEFERQQYMVGTESQCDFLTLLSFLHYCKTPHKTEALLNMGNNRKCSTEVTGGDDHCINELSSESLIRVLVVSKIILNCPDMKWSSLTPPQHRQLPLLFPAQLTQKCAGVLEMTALFRES
ncbi:homeobox protein H2.0 [Biomphalaria glabrata]|nr:homeobox protein H2.0 [Biomphalaria glabrata]